VTTTDAILDRVTDRRASSAGAGDGSDRATTEGLGLTADDLLAATGGRILARSPRLALGAAVDSRVVEAGNLFVALPGERTDGHRFVGAALAARAAAVIVARPPDDVDLAAHDATVVLVEDPLRALQGVAAAWRLRFDPLVVGVTGSIAKTSTKEAIAAVLAAAMPTLRNEGNLNNEIGLPLTVLRLRPEHRAAVLEMGMYVGGEIRDLARIGRPEIGVVTAVQPVHISRIGTIDAIEQAKGELVEALPDDGVAVLNADDERVRRMASRTRARAVTYGFAADADISADDITSQGLDGMSFTLVAAGERQPLSIPTLGRMAVHNALAAAAVGLAAGLSAADIEAGLAVGWSAPHRAEVQRAGGVTIVDDSYNASPGSVAAAMELLTGLNGRRIAVLGEMLELGDEHETGHRRVGEIAASVVDRLVVVGAGASAVADGARAAGLADDRIVMAEDRAAGLERLNGIVEPGDIVLVKASRGIALDLLVDELVEALGGRTP
jgi:UDP-N-acetylmuramoyl-tripeptide--D-alanyl-D-alanine ligase